MSEETALSREHSFLDEVQTHVTYAESVLGGDVRLFDPGGFYHDLIRSCKETDRDKLPRGIYLENLETSDLYIGVRHLEFQGSSEPIKLVEVSRPIDRTWVPHIDVMYFVRVERYSDLRKAFFSTKSQRQVPFPILDEELTVAFKRNTIEFLKSDPARYQKFNVPFRRGILLSGSPGNGKTMALRWLENECKREGFQTRVVTPDQYLEARAWHYVDDLFRLKGKGVIFFDDLDIALRSREDPTSDGWDQANFLTALDGVRRQEEVVYVFTSNIDLAKLDEAIMRSGRIDQVLSFPPPDKALRVKFIQSWPEELVKNVVVDEIAEATKDLSYASIEEIRRLFVFLYLERGEWLWPEAFETFQRGKNHIKVGLLRTAVS